jgi:hypothetical protein
VLTILATEKRSFQKENTQLESELPPTTDTWVYYLSVPKRAAAEPKSPSCLWPDTDNWFANKKAGLPLKTAQTENSRHLFFFQFPKLSKQLVIAGSPQSVHQPKDNNKMQFAIDPGIPGNRPVCRDVGSGKQKRLETGMTSPGKRKYSR